MKRTSLTTGIEKLTELFASCQQKSRVPAQPKKKQAAAATWCGHRLSPLDQDAGINDKDAEKIGKAVKTAASLSKKFL